MTAHTQRTSTPTDSSSQGSPDLGATIRRSVESPFAALIASIEELGKELPETDLRDGRVDNAVEMLESVRHGVQALVDLVAPESTTPLSCTLDELGRSAVRATPAQVRDQIQIAVEDGDAVVNVDGPRISRCLSYLLFANLAPGQDALFRTHVAGDCGAFTLLLPQNSQIPTSEGQKADNSFMQLVAERELIRLGGSLECRELRSGVVKVTASFPLASSAQSNTPMGGAL